MIESNRTESHELSIGAFSILRTLVELNQAGAVNLPIHDFVEAQRERGDNQLADAIDAYARTSGQSPPKREVIDCCARCPYRPLQPQ